MDYLPKPCLKGYVLVTKITKDEYYMNLKGKLTLSKGDKLYQIKYLRSRISNLWNPEAECCMDSLGKRLYEFEIFLKGRS